MHPNSKMIWSKLMAVQAQKQSQSNNFVHFIWFFFQHIFQLSKHFAYNFEIHIKNGKRTDTQNWIKNTIGIRSFTNKNY